MGAALVHELPGRLRFSLPYLRRDGRRAATLRDRLAALPGVLAASASPLTGSVLVTHDGQIATREQVIATIEGSLPLPSLDRPALQTSAAVHQVVHSLVETLLERALEALIAAVI